MYNVKYLKKNFPGVPLGKWDFLYGINLNLSEKGEIKFYFASSYGDYLYKLSDSGVSKQFFKSKACLDFYPLSKIFDHTINLDSITIDCYDTADEAYYLFLEYSSLHPYSEVLQFLIKKYRLSPSLFFDKVNYLNCTSVKSIEECHKNKCISFIKLSPASKSFKIYSRPFKYNSFNILPETKEILLKVLNCEEEKLIETLYGSVNAYDFEDGRTLLYTLKS